MDEEHKIKHEFEIVTKDKPSIEKRFGWDIVGNVNIPCVFRFEDDTCKQIKYTAAKIVEKKILCRFAMDVLKSARKVVFVPSKGMTAAEADLLNEINTEHAGGLCLDVPLVNDQKLVPVEQVKKFVECLESVVARGNPVPSNVNSNTVSAIHHDTARLGPAEHPELVIQSGHITSSSPPQGATISENNQNTGNLPPPVPLNAVTEIVIDGQVLPCFEINIRGVDDCAIPSDIFLLNIWHINMSYLLDEQAVKRILSSHKVPILQMSDDQKLKLLEYLGMARQSDAPSKMMIPYRLLRAQSSSDTCEKVAKDLLHYYTTKANDKDR